MCGPRSSSPRPRRAAMPRGGCYRVHLVPDGARRRRRAHRVLRHQARARGAHEGAGAGARPARRPRGRLAPTFVRTALTAQQLDDPEIRAAPARADPARPLRDAGGDRRCRGLACVAAGRDGDRLEPAASTAAGPHGIGRGQARRRSGCKAPAVTPRACPRASSCTTDGCETRRSRTGAGPIVLFHTPCAYETKPLDYVCRACNAPRVRGHGERNQWISQCCIRMSPRRRRHDAAPRSPRHRQAVRPRHRARRRGLQRQRRRGHRADRRQRRRQEHAGEGALGRVRPRRGRAPAQGRAGQARLAAARPRARHRDRLPGPRAGARARAGRERLHRPRAAQAGPARQARRARQGQDAQAGLRVLHLHGHRRQGRRRARRVAVRRPAPERRDLPLDHVGQRDRLHGRADGRARRPPDAQGDRARPPRRRTRRRGRV